MLSRSVRLASTLALFLMGVAGSSCADETASEPPDAPLTVEPDIEATAVSARFTVTIDPASAALLGKTLEPVEGAASVTGATGSAALRAFVKRLPARPGILWVELFFENRTPAALRGATVTIVDEGGLSVLHDFTNDPFAEPTDERTLVLGGVAKEGMARLAIGVPDGGGPVKIDVKLDGRATKRASTASSPVAVTSDGAEAWMAWPDGDVVAVVDAASGKRIATVPVPGRPTSVGITPDGSYVLVASSSANTVSIIDRAKRAVVQTLGESDGIGREPRSLALSPDGSYAYVSAYVGDTITRLGRHGTRYRVEGTLAVGRRPTGIAIAPDGATLLVPHFLPRGTVTRNEAWVSVVATGSFTLAREVIIEDSFNAKQVECLANVFSVSASRLTTEASASELFGVFFNPGGTEAWIPAMRVAGAIPVWERGPKSQPLASLASIRVGELVAPFQLALDTRTPADAAVMALPGVLDPPDVNLKYVACARLGLEVELISRDLIPSAPGEQVNRAAAFPTATVGLSESGMAHVAAFTRGGRRMLTLAHASDEIVVTDALTHHPTSQRHFALSGSNPSGIALTPDGAKAYVVYDNASFASVIDLSAYAKPGALPGPSYVPYVYRDVPDFPSAPGALTGKRIVRTIAGVPDRPSIAELAQIPLIDADPMDAELRRGSVLFHSSNPDKHPTLSATRLGSCAGCHPGGGNDGSMWGTMEGERRTTSLRGGVAGRGWLHAMGTHADAKEFVDTIVRERLGGDLAAADSAALARYVAFGIPRLQSPRVDEALAAAGQKVFAAKCAGCHQGAQMTSGNPDASSPLGGGAASGPLLYDVGTVTDDAHVILGTFFESLFPALESKLFKGLRGDRDLGPGDFAQVTLDFRPRPARKRAEFKAPSLVDVWDNAIFFHDGRYDSLDGVVQHLDETLSLGLSKADRAAVVEYLHTL
jgi:YVTN family beta-propeller protein